VKDICLAMSFQFLIKVIRIRLLIYSICFWVQHCSGVVDIEIIINPRGPCINQPYTCAEAVLLSAHCAAGLIIICHCLLGRHWKLIARHCTYWARQIYRVIMSRKSSCSSIRFTTYVSAFGARYARSVQQRLSNVTVTFLMP